MDALPGTSWTRVWSRRARLLPPPPPASLTLRPNPVRTSTPLAHHTALAFRVSLCVRVLGLRRITRGSPRPLSISGSHPRHKKHFSARHSSGSRFHPQEHPAALEGLPVLCSSVTPCCIWRHQFKTFPPPCVRRHTKTLQNWMAYHARLKSQPRHLFTPRRSLGIHYCMVLRECLFMNFQNRQNRRSHSLASPSCFVQKAYRGTSLIINTPLLGPFSRTIPRVL